MAVSTTTTLDDLFVNIVAAARFTAEQESIMLGLVTQYPIGNEAGKVIQVPKYPAVTAADLTEGTDMSSTTVSTSSVSVTVAEVGVQVVLTDLAMMGAGNPADEIGTVLGNSIATKIDKDLIALFDGFSTAIGSAGTELLATHIFQAAANLKTAKAPGPYYAVLHPKQAFSLKANLTNTFANPASGVVQNRAMESGFIGSLAGIDIYESANITIDGSDDGKAAVFAPQALAIAIKRDFTIETQRDASLRGTEYNATAIYGVGELDDSYGVEMLFDAAI